MPFNPDLPSMAPPDDARCMAEAGTSYRAININFEAAQSARKDVFDPVV